MSTPAPIWMQNTMWRETGRQVRVGPLDARLMIFVVLLLISPGLTLFYITMMVIAFFYYLEYKGYTLYNAYRKSRVIVGGRKKLGVHYWRQYKFLE